SATVFATNSASVPPAQASITVQCPSLSVTKAAEAAPVQAGHCPSSSVFVSYNSSSGTGTATGASLHHPLPARSRLNWAISPTYPGLGVCTIIASAGIQILSCSFGDMSLSATASVPAQSSTLSLHDALPIYSATVFATNSASVPPAQASITVQCPG